METYEIILCYYLDMSKINALEALKRYELLKMQDLYQINTLHNINETVLKENGRPNKGWQGNVCERFVTRSTINPQDDIDLVDAEIKGTPLTVSKKGNFTVKEPLSITLSIKDIINNKFEDTKLFKKLSRMILCRYVARVNYHKSSLFLEAHDSDTIKSYQGFLKLAKNDFEVIKKIISTKTMSEIKKEYKTTANLPGDGATVKGRICNIFSFRPKAAFSKGKNFDDITRAFTVRASTIRDYFYDDNYLKMLSKDSKLIEKLKSLDLIRK